MSSYEYKCMRCRRVTIEVFKMGRQPSCIPCPCGGVAKRYFSAPSIHIFQPFFHPDIDEGDGIMIETKNQWVDELTKRGSYNPTWESDYGADQRLIEDIGDAEFKRRKEVGQKRKEYMERKKRKEVRVW